MIDRTASASPTTAAYAGTEVEANGRKRKFQFRPKTTDETVIKHVFTDRSYFLGWARRGPELAAYFDKHSKPGRAALVIDLGANIGASAVYFHMLLGRARIVAVEPSAENFKLLERNTAGLDIRCINAAASATKGLSQVVDSGKPGDHWAYQTAPVGSAPAQVGRPVEIVQRVTLNDLYAEESGRSFPFLVKIDIEGGEADLFSAHTEWVERTPIVIIELHDWMKPKSRSAASFLRCIAALDRDFLLVGENVYSIANRLD